ncbi:MAG TPA: hypothetical protein PK777_16860, partial [Thermoguttaceae bacterium]|nr:hypothetical protein [Thermoguttaceae bacterium]
MRTGLVGRESNDRQSPAFGRADRILRRTSALLSRPYRSQPTADGRAITAEFSHKRGHLGSTFW